MNERPGLFIANEGPDGSGKETQTTLLCKRLAANYFTVHRLDFPTYGKDPVADTIRALLRSARDTWTARPWEARALLFAANRVLFRDTLREWLSDPSAVVVCNRYVPSNQAHMAGYVEDPREQDRRRRWIANLEYDILNLPRPDIVFLHTMPADTSRKLLEKRGDLDAHEEDAVYLQRVSACYEALAALEPSVWRSVAASPHGSLQSPRDVHARVWVMLNRHPVWKAFVRQPA